MSAISTIEVAEYTSSATLTLTIDSVIVAECDAYASGVTEGDAALAAALRYVLGAYWAPVSLDMRIGLTMVERSWPARGEAGHAQNELASWTDEPATEREGECPPTLRCPVSSAVVSRTIYVEVA